MKVLLYSEHKFKMMIPETSNDEASSLRWLHYNINPTACLFKIFGM